MEYGDFWDRHFASPTCAQPRPDMLASLVRGCPRVPYSRVWAHHSPSPKRNLRKGWFFEPFFFVADSILLDSTQFYCFYSILLDFDSILLNSTRFYSILLKFMQNQYKSQITTTQASASPGDSSMGTTGPDYMGIGMGPRARPGFVRKLYTKTCNFDKPPRFS